MAPLPLLVHLLLLQTSTAVTAHGDTQQLWPPAPGLAASPAPVAAPRRLLAALASLGALPTADTTPAACYSVQRVTRTDVGGGGWTVRVDVHVVPQLNVAGEGGAEGSCSSPPTPAAGRDPPPDTRNVTLVGRSRDTAGGNGSEVTVAADASMLLLGGGRTLSRTQLVVIISCSTVIGTFFLVAIALRIRNYVKRRRAASMRRFRAMSGESTRPVGYHDRHGDQSATPTTAVAVAAKPDETDTGAPMLPIHRPPVLLRAAGQTYKVENPYSSATSSRKSSISVQGISQYRPLVTSPQGKSPSTVHFQRRDFQYKDDGHRLTSSTSVVFRGRPPTYTDPASAHGLVSLSTLTGGCTLQLFLLTYCNTMMTFALHFCLELYL